MRIFAIEAALLVWCRHSCSCPAACKLVNLVPAREEPVLKDATLHMIGWLVLRM